MRRKGRAVLQLIEKSRPLGRVAGFLGRSPETATGDDIRRFQLAQGAQWWPIIKAANIKGE
jgi:hypothetical protein